MNIMKWPNVCPVPLWGYPLPLGVGGGGYPPPGSGVQIFQPVYQ